MNKITFILGIVMIGCNPKIEKESNPSEWNEARDVTGRDTFYFGETPLART